MSPLQERIRSFDLVRTLLRDITGWSPGRVSPIRKVYVDPMTVVVALGKRIAAKQIAKQSGSEG